MKTIKSFTFLILPFLILSCEMEIPEHLTPYPVEISEWFPLLEVPENNPLTVEGVQLGRMLYYDEILEQDQVNSCSSCHVQEFGFTSTATDGAPPVLPHVNLTWSDAFLWNGKLEGTLEDTMLFEVEEFFKTDFSQLNNHPTYPALFKNVFGVDEITSYETALALAQFLRVLISDNSKFDRFMKGLEPLTPSELNGYLIFNTEKGDCFHCHGYPLMTDNLFHNNGLNSTFEGEDRGRHLVTGYFYDMGTFKTPTLRNVGLRTYYMHDGRFQTLEEVIEHYNSGVLYSVTLDPLMTHSRTTTNLNLTEQEKEDLVAFLKTLTDTSILNNPEFSNPFE